MTAIESFQEGRLAEAIEAQLKEVRSHPTDAPRRLFLVELLAFTGDADRARRQLDAVPTGDPKIDKAVRDARDLVDAHAARLRLFATGEQPRLFSSRPSHIDLRLEGLEMLRAGNFAQATSKLAEAAEAAEDIPGTLDDRPFTRLRDTDDRLAGVLEVLALGRYYWVPLEQVTGLAMNPPKYPRDLLFIPARLEMGDETGEVFLPATYPGSSAEPDPQIQLGRLTDWRPSGPDGPAIAFGSKVFQVDDDDVALIDWRKLIRDVVAPTEPAAESVP